MGYWLYINEDTKKEVEKDGFSRESMKNQQFRLTLADEPMHKGFFDYSITELIKNMRIGEGHFLIIGYPTVREDNVSAIQVQRMEPQNGFWIELIMVYDDGQDFHTYCKNDVSTEETIKIFRKVVVDYTIPFLGDWDEITDIVLEGSERAKARVNKRGKEKI